MLEIIILAIALVVIALVFIGFLMTGSPPMPTSLTVLKVMLEMLPARLPGSSENAVYELGSGWGGVAMALAKKYPQQSVVGFERAPLPYLVSKIRTWIFKKPGVQIKSCNFLKSDISNAQLVVCYLMPDMMARLKPKFESELAIGCLVLSNNFAVPGWTPLDRVGVADFSKSQIYLYEMGVSQELPFGYQATPPDHHPDAG